MKAYSIGASADRFYVNTWSCEYFFPGVHCSACGEESWDTFVWFPCLSLGPKADPSRFNNEITVEIEEFKEISKTVAGQKCPGTKLMPAAGIVTVKAKLPRKGADFLWCEIKPLIKASARGAQ